MLRSLYVRDYALIEELEVEFGSGLNILTGETGAGKSIVVGAMKMILGERASTEVVRTGAKKAVIEGVFDHADSPRIQAILDEYDVEPQPELIVRREIRATQSRAFINDSPATAQALRVIAAELIDLHGQHDNQSLLRTEHHIELLDHFGGLGGLVAKYATERVEMERLQQERRRLVAREKELRQQKELIEFQIAEIDAVKPVAGEEDDLEAERKILENAEELSESTTSLHQMLYEGEESVYDQLVVARNTLDDLLRIDRQFEGIYEEIRSAEIIISEITSFLQDYSAGIEFNPERLEEIRERLGELSFLKKKYGGSLESVLQHREEIGQTYELAADFEGAIARLDAEIETARERLSDAAGKLSAKRKKVAKRIETAIRSELVDLGIANGRLDVRFERVKQKDGWVALDEQGWQAFENGVDQVEFYISTNLGEKPKPLARTASGGEISRIMLALKSILAKSDRLPILVFDEIDTGISGAVAQQVGRSMKSLAQYHQIIAITHLPQIAALGDVHFRIEKTEQAGRTRSHLRRLSDDDRAREIAGLLSGTDITDAALESARQLMG